MRFFVLALLCAAAFCCVGSPARPALVLNEVCYDPEGPDSGSEWVELFNTGPWPAGLEGVALESGNGSGPGQWARVWTGSSGDWCEAGGTFWIGGPSRGRNPDSIARLDLQNGPDGVRLVRDGLELDRVGWGELSLPEYFEGTPLPGAGAGRSLARRVDGVDSDQNHLDFEDGPPTPGRPNHPQDDLALRLYRRGRPLPVPSPDGAVQAWMRLQNRGARPLEPSRISLLLDGRTLLPDPGRIIPTLAPGEEIEWSVLLPVLGEEGEQFWSCWGRIDGDPVPENDVDTLRLWVGAPPVRLNEIAPRPDSSGTEWIELRVSEGGALPLTGWVLQDHGGSEAELDSTPVLPSGTIRLLARNARDLPDVDPSALLPWKGSWPTLNDVAGPSGAADSVFLYDPHGRLVDWAAFGRAARGATWVRRDGAPPGSGLAEWSVDAVRTGGSPGTDSEEPESSTPDEDARYAPEAWSFDRAGEGLWIRIPSEQLPGEWSIRVFDLNGREVHEASGRSADRMDQWANWDVRGPDGEPCRAGLYLLRLEARRDTGPVWNHQQSLVLGR